MLNPTHLLLFIASGHCLWLFGTNSLDFLSKCHLPLHRYSRRRRSAPIVPLSYAAHHSKAAPCPILTSILHFGTLFSTLTYIPSDCHVAFTDIRHFLQLYATTGIQQDCLMTTRPFQHPLSSARRRPHCWDVCCQRASTLLFNDGQQHNRKPIHVTQDF